jgi:hypothetical protein
MNDPTPTDRYQALRQSPLMILTALSPRLQDAAVTLMFKKNNAPVCKDILLGKLQGWETSLQEYQSKAPVALADVIDDLEKKSAAARFALGLPARNATPPAVSYISCEHMSTALQLIACRVKWDWLPAALSTEQPRQGGGVSAWMKRANAPQDSRTTPSRDG